MLAQAFELCEDGDYLEALKIYDSVIKKNPKNIQAIIDKAVTLQNIGRLKQSIKLYDKALQIDPSNIDALGN